MASACDVTVQGRHPARKIFRGISVLHMLPGSPCLGGGRLGLGVQEGAQGGVDEGGAPPRWQSALREAAAPGPSRGCAGEGARRHALRLRLQRPQKPEARDLRRSSTSGLREVRVIDRLRVPAQGSSIEHARVGHGRGREEALQEREQVRQRRELGKQARHLPCLGRAAPVESAAASPMLRSRAPSGLPPAAPVRPRPFRRGLTRAAPGAHDGVARGR